MVRKFGHQVQFIIEFDYLSRNDFLGIFKFKVDGDTGEFSTTMDLVEENSTASYILKWEILED